MCIQHASVSGINFYSCGLYTVTPLLYPCARLFARIRWHFYFRWWLNVYLHIWENCKVSGFPLSIKGLSRSIQRGGQVGEGGTHWRGQAVVGPTRQHGQPDDVPIPPAPGIWLYNPMDLQDWKEIQERREIPSNAFKQTYYCYCYYCRFAKGVGILWALKALSFRDAHLQTRPYVSVIAVKWSWRLRRAMIQAGLCWRLMESVGIR